MSPAMPPYSLSHCPCCGQPMPVQGLSLERFTKRVRLGKESVQLTASEFKLLDRLMHKPGQWVALDDIIFAMWINIGEEEPVTAVRVVSTMTYRLRKKLWPWGFSIEAHKTRGRRITVIATTEPSERGFSATTNRSDLVYTQSVT